MKPIFTVATELHELNQILDLQSRNLERNISCEELKSQGFVTVRHDLKLLEEMNTPYPHIIAKDGDKVAGYALVMLRTFSDKVPVLVPMFQMIDNLFYNGCPVKELRYFVMGQICVDKQYRGQGVFSGLYIELKSRMREEFDYVITEVASRNTRSMHAHTRVGFKSVSKYTSVMGEEWNILIWNINK